MQVAFLGWMQGVRRVILPRPSYSGTFGARFSSKLTPQEKAESKPPVSGLGGLGVFMKACGVKGLGCC